VVGATDPNQDEVMALNDLGQSCSPKFPTWPGFFIGVAGAALNYSLVI
jgi:hypothetical protein